MHKLIFLCLLSSCIGRNSLPYDEKIAYKLMNNFSKNYSKNLQTAALGLMQDKSNKKIGAFDLVFHTNETLTIETARQNVITAVQALVNYVNQTPEIAPFVTTYPISYEQVIVTFSGNENSLGLSNYVSSVIGGKKGISYFLYPIKPPNFGLIKTESFEEAICLLNSY